MIPGGWFPTWKVSPCVSWTLGIFICTNGDIRWKQGLPYYKGSLRSKIRAISQFASNGPLFENLGVLQIVISLNNLACLLPLKPLNTLKPCSIPLCIKSLILYLCSDRYISREAYSLPAADDISMNKHIGVLLLWRYNITKFQQSEARLLSVDTYSPLGTPKWKSLC